MSNWGSPSFGKRPSTSPPRSARAEREESSRLTGRMHYPVDGRLFLNERGLNDLKDCDHLHRVEFLYLRENLLNSFLPVRELAGLLILDVSNNFITSFEQLPPLPLLKQLYLNGNCLNSLEGMPMLLSLEVLSLSHNQLTSLEGLPLLPSLRVLSVAGNEITSLAGLPRLPDLECVRLQDNPVASWSSYRTAVIACSSPSLLSIDGSPIVAEERRTAGKLSAKAVLCLREGWDWNSQSLNEKDLDRFLVGFQRTITKGNAVELVHMTLLGSPQEGSRTEICTILAARSDASLEEGEEMFLASDLIGQLLQWEGQAETVSAMFLSCNGTELDNEEGLGHVELFATPDSNGYFRWFFLTPGEYKYCFIVNGNVELDHIRTLSISDEMAMNARSRMLQKGESEKETFGMFTIQWYRSNEDGDFVESFDFTSRYYDTSLDDVGCCLMAEVSAILPSESHPLPSMWGIGAAVVAAKPTCRNLTIDGEPHEGFELKPDYMYFGGREGKSKVEWFTSGELVGTDWSYTPNLDDVGHMLSISLTPVSVDGTEGEKEKVDIGVVQCGTPELTSLEIRGDAMEGQTLECVADFFGGLEGYSIIEWFRVNDSGELFRVQSATGRQKYTLGVDDCGKRMKLKYRPVNTNGTRGEVVEAELKGIVGSLAPHVKDLSLSGDLVENSPLELSFVYEGGVEGDSDIVLFRKQDSDADWQVVKPFSHSDMEYTLKFEDIGYFFRVEYEAVRADGVRASRVVTYETPCAVSPGLPTVISMEITGESIQQGEELVLSVKYVGGIEGESTFQWFRGDDPIENTTNIKAYSPGLNEVGTRLSVRYTPVRSDGVVGTEASCVTSSEILPAPPQIRELYCEAKEYAEREVVHVYFVYWGGEKGPCEILWHRVGETDEVVESTDDDSSVCNITSEDVGCKLYAEITPVRDDMERGEPVRSEETPIISPGSPKIDCLEMPNKLFEGQPVKLKYEYFGGAEGDSMFTWSRISATDPEETEVVSKEREYVPEPEDVGFRLSVTVVPARSDGILGKEAFAISDPDVLVGSGPPDIRDLSLTGEPKIEEGGVVVLQAKYVGGVEGDSQIKWFREDGSEKVALSYLDGKMKKPLELIDVGRKILVEYEPVRRDGQRGEVHTVMTTAVEPTFPKVTDVSVSGTAREGGYLNGVGKYSGGFEGTSKVRWLRVGKDGKTAVVSSDYSFDYQVRLADTDCVMKFEYTPVRNDGVVGEPVVADCGTIAGDPPSVSKVRLLGGPYFSEPIRVHREYSGGVEGKSIVKWFRKIPGGAEFTAFANAKGKQYFPSPDDVLCQFKVQYTPARRDGEKGTAVMSNAVELHINGEFFTSIVEQLRLGETTLEVNNMDSKQDELLTLNHTMMKLGTASKLVSKGKYGAPLNVECSGDKGVIVTFTKKKTSNLSFSTRRNRDFMILISRVYMALGDKSLVTNVWDKSTSKLWAGKKEVGWNSALDKLLESAPATLKVGSVTSAVCSGIPAATSPVVAAVESLRVYRKLERKLAEKDESVRSKVSSLSATPVNEEVLYEPDDSKVAEWRASVVKPFEVMLTDEEKKLNSPAEVVEETKGEEMALSEDEDISDLEEDEELK